MYNQVIFYNHFGAGDIFESREFVKEWMKLVPANSYHYAHGKDPRILLDIPEIKFKDVTEHMNPMRGVWDDLNGNLYVNTWIGRDGKYVLPGIGCTVEKLYDMHNDMLRVYNLGELSGTPYDYIPNIEYSIYSLFYINEFLYSHPQEKIIIDNGVVQSMQAENFPMDSIITALAEKLKDRCFITVQPVQSNAQNIFYAGDITKRMGFDLPEISYLSTFCTTLIGRNSGPHVHMQVKKNIDNEKTKLLSFTYHQQGSSFVVNTDVKIRKYWSPETSFDSVLNKMLEVINE